MTKTKKIVLAGLLLATAVVLSRFLSIKTPIIMISFSFIPYMLAGVMLGPWWTMLIAALGDLTGALLFPFGAYFPGYTLSSAIMGFVYGWFLHREKNKTNKKFIFNLIISTLIVLVVCNGVLNSLWIFITTKKAFWAIMPTRLLKQLVMFPIQITVIYFLNFGLEKMGVYKFLYTSAYEDMGDEKNVDNKSDNTNGDLIKTEENKPALKENLKNSSLHENLQTKNEEKNTPIENNENSETNGEK